MVILISICAQPVKSGVERVTLLLVPLMILLLMIGLILALMSSGMLDSIRYILHADFTAMDARTPIVALQRAFYTLVLGIGVMMAYGRYLPAEMSEAEVEVVVDTVIVELGAAGKKDMGRIMKEVMSRVAGRADGKLVSTVVGARLT